MKWHSMLMVLGLGVAGCGSAPVESVNTARGPEASALASAPKPTPAPMVVEKPRGQQPAAKDAVVQPAAPGGDKMAPQDQQAFACVQRASQAFVEAIKLNPDNAQERVKMRAYLQQSLREIQAAHPSPALKSAGFAQLASYFTQATKEALLGVDLTDKYEATRNQDLIQQSTAHFDNAANLSEKAGNEAELVRGRMK